MVDYAVIGKEANGGTDHIRRIDKEDNKKKTPKNITLENARCNRTGVAYRIVNESVIKAISKEGVDRG